MEDREGTNFVVEEAPGLIDVSLANDSFVRTAAMSSSTVTDDVLNINGHQFSGTQSVASSFKFSGAPHTDKALEMAQASEQSEQLPQLLETSEPERATKSGKCNLRKSLAWDSAFFTSAGVLDAEELSTMIKGGDKGVKHLLPGIEEDVHTSMDSISTLESDNLTLENLEADLFEDIRASIQKSSRASYKANLSCKAAPGGTSLQTQASTSLKKIELAAGSKLTLKSGGKMQTNAIPSGKMIKQGSSSPQVTQSVMRIRESTSSIPHPTKSISRVNSMPSTTSKRASLSANQVKVVTNNSPHTSVNQKGAQASKVTSLAGPRRGVPKSSISSRPSSLGSSTASKTESMRSSSSCGSSGSSSENIGKSPVNSARRNYSKPVNSSEPIPQKASTIAPRSKTSGLTSGLSAHMGSLKLSSSISPASSISEWSTESSSSSSTVNQRSTSRPNLEASSSCRSSNGDMDLNIHFTDKMPSRNRNHRAELPSQNIKKAAAQTSSLSRPDSMKPSGLRMPSPKIGFFDGSKLVRTPNGGMQSQARLSTGFPKDGAGLSSPIGSSNKAKLGKLPPTKVVKASTSMKPATRGSASPKLSQGLPSPSAKVSIASKDAEYCLVKSPKVQTETGEISYLKNKHEIESRKLEISNDKLSINMKEIAEVKEIMILLPEEGITDSSLNTCVDNLKSLGVGEDAIHGQDDLKNTSGETDEKETDHFGVQVDDLARDFGAMDLQLAMQKKIAFSTKTCCELSWSNPCPHELCSNQNFIDIQKEEPTADIEEIVVPLTEGGIIDPSLDSCVSDIKPHGTGKDVIHGQGDQKNELLEETDEKETDHFGDQFDDLARDFVVTDLQLAMQKEIAGSSKAGCELGSNPCPLELCSKQNFIDIQKEEPTADVEEIVVPLTEGGITDPILDSCVGDIKPHGVGKDVIHGQGEQKNELLEETDEKETDHFGDQFDDLARDFVVMDLQLAMQKEIAGSSKAGCELGSNPCAPELCSKQNFIDIQKEEPAADVEEIVVRLTEGGITDPILDSCVGDIKLHGAGKDVIHENELLEETDEKETHHFGDQFDDLARDFVVTDLQLAMQKEIAGSSKAGCELGSNPCAPELCSKQNFIDIQKEEPAADVEEIVVPLTEGGITDPILDSCVGDIKPHGAGKDVIHGQGDQKNELLEETDEKETDHFGDQFDELARDFIVTDLQLAMQKEIAGSSKAGCELGSNPCSKLNFIDVQKKERTFEIVTPLPEGGITDSSLHTCVGDIKPHGVVEDAIHGQDDLKSKTPGQTKEMETDPFGGQVDDIARSVAMDLQLMLQKEIAASINSCCELTCSNPCAPEVCSGKTIIEVHMEEPTANTRELGCSNPHSPELYFEKNFIEVQMEELTAKLCDFSCSNPSAPESCSDENFYEVQTDKPSDNSCEPCCSNPYAPELCSEKNFIEVQKEDPTASSRTPLTEKNSFCNSEGLDVLTGSGIELVEKTVDLPSSEIAQKENI